MPVTNNNRTYTQVAISADAGANRDLVAAPGAGLKIYVTRLVFTMSAAGKLKFTEGTGPTDLSGDMDFAAAGGAVAIGDGREPVLQTKTANAKLGCTPTTGNVRGWLTYFVDA